MAFDRKQYGMNSGIRFIKIANRVEMSVALKGKRVSGLPWSSSNSKPCFVTFAALVSITFDESLYRQ